MTDELNIVSQPPLTTPIIDTEGNPSRAWAIWFRDIYNRVAYKGGNAIDENADLIDGTIETLDEAIEQIILNAFNIQQNAEDIDTNTQNLDAHVTANQAHGSNGDIVGFDDLATETINGLVRRMAQVSNAVQSSVNVSEPDASAAPAAYDQAQIQELVDLSNANKAAINQLVTDFNNAVVQLNALLQEGRDKGQMTP